MAEVAPDIRLDDTPAGPILRLSGAWCLGTLARIEARLAALPPLQGSPNLDGGALTHLDSAGALLLIRHMEAWDGRWNTAICRDFTPAHLALLTLVADRLHAPVPVPERPAESLLQRLGQRTLHVWGLVLGQFSFFGRVLEALAELVRQPRRFRSREVFVQLEQVGLEALPIVALMTFLIGVVFAYLLGIQIEKYGANIFIVDGVGLSITRELAPLLTAVLVAGRSGAAFTAQIGAMKVTEETDAITTLGLSPIQVLVVPRLIAIVATMPLMTFFGDVMGLLGSAMVAAQKLDITFYTFFDRLKDVLPLSTVLFGLAKAPVFAAAIALIACANGFAVSRDARSVGEHTTNTVVRCLVAVILIDAAFAIAFPELTP